MRMRRMRIMEGCMKRNGTRDGSWLMTSRDRAGHAFDAEDGLLPAAKEKKDITV